MANKLQALVRAIQHIGIIMMLMVSLNVTIFANDATVSNVVFSNQNTTANTVRIQFDLSWDNSWRDPNAPTSGNYDGVWVFAKYRIGTGNWTHCVLSATSGDHGGGTTGTTLTTQAVSDQRGVMFHRTSAGTGDVTNTGCYLSWDYGANGITDDNQILTVRVFAVETVFVPQGAFQLGDGTVNDASHRGSFQRYIGGVLQTGGFPITSESAITTVATSGTGLVAQPDVSGAPDVTGRVFTIPASFPKGYDAFWCMKYEITQGQYVDFLNAISSVQASARYPNANGAQGHTIVLSGTSYTTTTPDRAVNYLGMPDLLAYLDWSALRPMSEFELTKAARGPATALADEYAWGSTSRTNVTSLIGSSGSGTETEGSANMNAVISRSNPEKVGICATLGPQTRENSGGSYWGIMDLTGNMWEEAATCYFRTGVNPFVIATNFDGTHGDGTLDAAGASNVTNWATNVSYGMHSGSYERGTSDGLTLSNRSYASYSISTSARSNWLGGRGVRKIGATFLRPIPPPPPPTAEDIETSKNPSSGFKLIPVEEWRKKYEKELLKKQNSPNEIKSESQQ